MEAFHPLRTRTHVPALQRRHPEERFWNAYDRQVCVRFDGAVQAIDFSPVDANQIAITAESRILVLDAGTGEVRKRFARTDTVAYGGQYRADGKLLVAGTDSGLVHIYNASSRSILRTFSGHKSAVRKTHFTIDKLRVVSASDDMTVRVTDLPTERCLLSIPHSDRVRAQASCAAAPHLWLTGCYDGGVRLFDLRMPNAAPVRMIWHARNEQVDDVCFISGESSTLIASAGGPYVRLWDLLQSDGQEQRHPGQMMVAEAERHRKAVMALAVDTHRHRLVSVSLDGALKVHELGTMTTLHTMHVGVGCICLGLSADGRVLATGQVDGLLRLQQRVRKASAVAETAISSETTREEHDFVRLARGHMDRGDPSRPYRPGTRRYFLRGMHLEPDPAVDDDIVSGEADSSGGKTKRGQLKAHDRHLRHFEYGKALRAVMETKQSALIVSMLAELDRRRGLQAALNGLNETELIEFVGFITKHILDSRYSSILAPVSHLILDLYGDIGSSTGPLRATLQRLATRVQQHVHHLDELEKMAASVELFLA